MGLIMASDGIRHNSPGLPNMNLLDNALNNLTRKNHWSKALFPLALFVLGFALVTLRQSDYGRAVPGDMGDARFNLIILEHLYRWSTGLDKSLWSPEFFYPYAGALSFSDNHFGTCAAYIIPRLLGLDPERAFITWYSLSAPLNYFACYFALRKLSLRPSASSVGAVIFAFALCASAQYGHAQLGYRFATPLAIASLMRFQDSSNSNELLKFFALLSLQFLCSIYIGYFLSLLAATLIISSYLVPSKTSPQKPFHASLLISLRKAVIGNDYVLLVGILGCTALLGLLFVPYIYYSHLYGFRRYPGEIFDMLPRLSSYLLSDGSLIWHDLSAKFSVPMRWEHQMFFGASAIALAIVGLVASPTISSKRFACAFFLLILLTLNIHNHSLYRLLIHLPLSNAIRAVSRICLVMLFPIAVLAATGFERLVTGQSKNLAGYLTFAIGGGLLAFMICEYATYSSGSVPIRIMQDDWQTLASEAPVHLPTDAILYVPDRFDELPGFNEINGMRLGQLLNRPTLNGYSGVAPDGFTTPLPTPCQKVNQRLADYIVFTKQGAHEFTSLVSRAYVLGDGPCTPDISLLHRTHFRGALSASMMRNIAISIQSISATGQHLFARLKVENHSDTTLATLSDDNHPVHISWRYVPVGRSIDPLTDWDRRMALASDTPPGGSQFIDVPVDTPTSPGVYYLEASMVQERISWFQTAGMSIARSAQLIKISPGDSASIVDGAR